MIDYKSEILTNGLTVVVHRERASLMAAVNLIYKVGSRDEDPEHTGFAHLFEHLMFRGTSDVPDFDEHVQRACGENNAFTNNDYTNFYITLPSVNLETALWLEADRMTGLNISEEALEAEKKVVIEEFKQRYLNQPYGDMWLKLRPMVYKSHPYRWATIGITPDHIANATIDQVRDFYTRHYQPSHAILSIASDREPDEMIALAHKWFDGISNSSVESSVLPHEPEQNGARREVVAAHVPAVSITIAFRMAGRTSEQFYHCDMISDILAGGTSSRLHRKLVKERRLFDSANAYVTGEIDPGLMIVTGRLLQGVSIQEGEAALWDELEEMKQHFVSDYEIDKVKNKFDANTLFGEINVMDKAMNLGFYTMLADTALVNTQVDIFRSITPLQIMETALTIFRPQNSSTLIYIPENE